MERQDLVNDDGTTDYGFEVTISSSITSDFEAIRSVYNITAIYNDDSVATCLYEGLIRIYDKEQGVVLYGNNNNQGKHKT